MYRGVNLLDKSDGQIQKNRLEFEAFVDLVSMIERLHRLLLDVVKDEFMRLNIQDINPVQAMILYHIGDSELSAGDLRARGYYQGSNVSYNLRKLVDMGYMDYKKNNRDKRSVRLSLTDKGIEIQKNIQNLFAYLFEGSFNDRASKDTLLKTRELLSHIEDDWLKHIRFLY